MSWMTTGVRGGGEGGGGMIGGNLTNDATNFMGDYFFGWVGRVGWE